MKLLLIAALLQGIFSFAMAQCEGEAARKSQASMFGTISSPEHDDFEPEKQCNWEFEQPYNNSILVLNVTYLRLFYRLDSKEKMCRGYLKISDIPLACEDKSLFCTSFYDIRACNISGQSNLHSCVNRRAPNHIIPVTYNQKSGKAVKGFNMEYYYVHCEATQMATRASPASSPEVIKIAVAVGAAVLLLLLALVVAVVVRKRLKKTDQSGQLHVYEEANLNNQPESSPYAEVDDANLTAVEATQSLGLQTNDAANYEEITFSSQQPLLVYSSVVRTQDQSEIQLTGRKKTVRHQRTPMDAARAGTSGSSATNSGLEEPPIAAEGASNSPVDPDRSNRRATAYEDTETSPYDTLYQSPEH